MLSSRCRSASCLVPLSVLVWLSCNNVESTRMAVPGTSFAQQSNERCPNEPYLRGNNWQHLTSEVRVPLADRTQHIPEYHDCQRLLVEREPNEGKQAIAAANHLLRLKYGPLVGVWARDGIDQLTRASFQSRVLPVAELYNFSPEPYAPLGLGRRYSCLYLAFNNGWHAFMVSQGGNPICPAALDTTVTPARRLEVKVQAGSRGLAPPAARWDMDPVSHIQYIGIWCPDGWCEIGVPGFQQSPVYPDGRGTLIKGWYDEQYLGVLDSVTGELRPSSIRGRTIPVRGLDTLDVNDFTCANCTDSDWVPVATVILEKDSAEFYRKKLHLRNGLNSPNQISIRNNTNTGGWEALIQSRPSDKARRKTIWINHQNIRVPGTSRWHFMGLDETVWVRCSDGCCDVTGLQ